MTVSSQLKQTVAGLKGVRSTLNIYAVQTNNEDEKSVFVQAVDTVDDIIGDLDQRVKVLEFEEPQYKGM